MYSVLIVVTLGGFCVRISIQVLRNSDCTYHPSSTRRETRPLNLPLLVVTVLMYMLSTMHSILGFSIGIRAFISQDAGGGRTRVRLQRPEQHDGGRSDVHRSSRW